MVGQWGSVGFLGRGQGALVPRCIPEDSLEGRQCPGCSQLLGLPCEEWLWDQVVLRGGKGLLLTRALLQHSPHLLSLLRRLLALPHNSHLGHLPSVPRSLEVCGLTLAELALQEL